MSASIGLAADAIYLAAAVPLLVAVGVSVAVWRSARRERVLRVLRTELASRDPAVRKAALEATTDELLASHAELYCDLLAREDDPEVLDALAAAVARSRWEPSDDLALVELRRWVAGGHARATRSSDAATEPAAGLASRDDAAPTHAGAPRSSAAAALRVPAAAAPSGLRPSDAELDELVPRVRELLGDALERLELVSIDGEVLKQWSSSADVPVARTAEGVDATS